jgi:hypothetical protein
MAKGQPFSVRLDEQTEKLIEAEARRTRRTKSAVVEAFTEETARTRRFAGIAFRGDDARRRAWVLGSGLDVWEIVHMLEDFGSSDALVANASLSPAQVHLAVAYRDAYPDEINRMIADNRRPIEDLRVLYPFIDVVEV